MEAVYWQLRNLFVGHMFIQIIGIIILFANKKPSKPIFKNVSSHVNSGVNSCFIGPHPVFNGPLYNNDASVFYSLHYVSYLWPFDKIISPLLFLLFLSFLIYLLTSPYNNVDTSLSLYILNLIFLRLDLFIMKTIHINWEGEIELKFINKNKERLLFYSMGIW